MVAQDPRKYHQAAVTYLVYGLIYWGGGFYLIETGISQQSGAAWFVIGGLFIVLFPPLIWYGGRSKILKWFTRLLAVFLVVRLIGLLRVILNDDGVMVPLPWGGEIALVYGAAAFMLVAAVACWMLARAGFQVQSSRFKVGS